MITKTILAKLAQAIQDGNNAYIGQIGSNVVRYEGLERWHYYFNKAKNIANTKPYKFVEFSAKVISDSAEEYNSNEVINPGHNED